MRNVIRIARVAWGYERNLNTEFITVNLVPQEREMGTSRKEPWERAGVCHFPDEPVNFSWDEVDEAELELVPSVTLFDFHYVQIELT